MKNLEMELTALLRSFQNTGGNANKPCSVRAPTPWELYMQATLSGGDIMFIRNLHPDDLSLLYRFRDELSRPSRELFCPYPWDKDDALTRTLTHAIRSAVQRRDFSCLILVGDRPIGHFFLWQAGGPASAGDNVHIPELGVAISDAYQKRGLGRLAVCIMQTVARALSCDAIELTTATDNDGGWHTYLKTGFAFVGMIRNPLEVDVTAVAAGHANTTTFRIERQMAYVIREERREEILRYLANKRATFLSK